MVYVAPVLVVLITATILFVAFKYENFFIAIEDMIGRKIRRVRHLVGAWLLRDLKSDPISDEAKAKIAYEYAAEHGFILAPQKANVKVSNSDDAFKELLIRMGDNCDGSLTKW